MIEYQETSELKKAKKVIKMAEEKNELLKVLDFYADEKNDKGKKARTIIERIRK